LGRYQDAAREYEQAYEATLDAALLFNIAQAYRLAGDRRKAITTYRSYLRAAPTGAQRGLAEAKLKELESQPDTVTPPPEVAPRPVRESPAPVAPAVTPAETAAPPSAPAAAVLVAPAPASALPTLERSPEPAATSPFYTRWPFWAVTGA